METEQHYSTQEWELLAAKYALDHWRHIIEGAEIEIMTDDESLKVYRTKKHQTKHLLRFMNDIKHYNPLFTYHPRCLQVVSDTLSRMPGTHEEGLPTDTPWFVALEDTNNPSKTPRRRRAEYFKNIIRYLNCDVAEMSHVSAMSHVVVEWCIANGLPMVCQWFANGLPLAARIGKVMWLRKVYIAQLALGGNGSCFNPKKGTTSQNSLWRG